MSATATFTVEFGRPVRSTVAVPVIGRVPQVAKLLAFAHEIDRRVRAAELNDFAHAARVFGLTRARVTQIVSLTLLAPAIQEEILALPPVQVGRDPITERTLRAVVAEPVWDLQLALWRALTGGPHERPRLLPDQGRAAVLREDRAGARPADHSPE